MSTKLEDGPLPVSWPLVARNGEARLAVASKEGRVITSVRDRAAPRLFGPNVTVYAGELAYRVDAKAEDAYDVSAAVPTVTAGAVPKRVADHVAGRYAAARALVAAGLAPALASRMGIGENGRPLWPSGFCGSITHGGDRVLAAASRIGETRSLGLDVERRITAETAAAVRDTVITPREARELAAHAPAFAAEEILTLVFSAKESVYKAVNPIVNRFFDFLAAEAFALDVAQGTMELRLLVDLGHGFARGRVLTARFALDGAHVVTAVELLG